MLSSMIFLPIIAIIVAIKQNRRFKYVSFFFSILSFVVGGILVYKANTCKEYFCGIDYGIQAAIYASGIALVAFIIAFIGKKITKL
jgi:hypothetical protein